MARLVALLALTMTAFAANSLLNRVALTDTGTGPAAFALLRMGAGAATLALLTLRAGGLHRLRGGLRWPNAIALAVYMLGFSFAYVSLDAGLGALILFGGVQITMFAGARLAGDMIPPRRWAGAGLAFGGLVWLLWPAGASVPPLTGAGLMAAAALGWGIFSLQGRKATDPMALTAGGFSLGVIPALAVFALLPDALTPAGAALAIVSGAVTSGLGYALWYALLPRLPSASAAVAQLTVPVIAAAGGVMLLDEALSPRLVIAALLVIAGVVLATPRPARPGQA